MPMYKSFAVKADGISEDGGTITGYASTFDREADSYGDVVAKGAFEKTLDAWRERDACIPLLYGHRTDDPKYNIGRVSEIGEDERGLLFTAELDAESEKAQYVRKLFKEGRIYQFSFAYDIRDMGEVELEDGTKVNELRELDLFEISVVQIPANQHAEVIDVKGLKYGRRNSKSDEDKIRQAISLLQSVLDEEQGDDSDQTDDSEGGEGKAMPEGREDVGSKEALMALLKEIEEEE